VSGIEVAGKKLKNGFQIAVAIPWTKLKTIPEPGLKIGFDIVGSDGDKGKARNVMMWSAPGKRVYSNPKYMGRATLQ